MLASLGNMLTRRYLQHDVHEIFQTIAIAVVRASGQWSTRRPDSNHVAVEVFTPGGSMTSLAREARQLISVSARSLG